MPEAGSPVPLAAERAQSRLPTPGPGVGDPVATALCLFAALVSAPEPAVLWRTLEGEAASLFEADHVRLYLARSEGDGLPPVSLSGEPGGDAVRAAVTGRRLVRGRRAMAAPIIADGHPVAVLEVSGEAGLAFTAAEAQRLAALGVAAGIALKTVERAADLKTLKSYCDAVLQATSNGVIGLDPGGRIVGCNPAALRMLRRRAVDVIGKQGRRVFRGDNAWVVEKARRVAATGLAEVAVDARLRLARRHFDVNATILPIASGGKPMVVFVLDDVSGREQAREVLSRYLDPRLAAPLLVRGQHRAAARPLRATLLFCDLRDSTRLAEGLGAQRMLALLNEHFALMEECLRAEGGMIDKFIGDALLATFGVPHPAGDDEDRAVRAALAMSAALRRWNETRAAAELLRVEMGIGINTDVVVAGDVGSPRRGDFTVVGAGVNAAARLEKACKASGSAILATANTVRRLKGRYAIRPADALIIPGRASPLEVFEILADLDVGAVDQLRRPLLLYRRAFASKRSGRFSEAIAGFSECLSLDPGDRAAARQLAACRAAVAARQD
jgi:adenylate cyclase